MIRKRDILARSIVEDCESCDSPAIGPLCEAKQIERLVPTLLLYR
jgi:hypothetical protein